MRLLKTYDFAVVTANKKKLRDHGIDRGDILFIHSHKALPHSNKDPYVQKVYMGCHKVLDGHVQIPTLVGGDNESYLVDGMSLEWVGEEEQNRFIALLEVDVSNNTKELES